MSQFQCLLKLLPSESCRFHGYLGGCFYLAPMVHQFAAPGVSSGKTGACAGGAEGPENRQGAPGPVRGPTLQG